MDMADKLNKLFVEADILKLRLGALEEILQRFTRDSTGPKPYINFEYVKEEIAAISRRSEEHYNLSYDDWNPNRVSAQILGRMLALKTIFIGIKQAPNSEDKIATLTARNQELHTKVEALEKADEARETENKRICASLSIATNRAESQREDRDEMQKSIEAIDGKIEKVKQSLGQMGGMFT